MYNAIDVLSASKTEDLKRDIKTFPWFGIHDNVNFSRRVFEQRSDHHSTFDIGTAATVVVVKDPDVVRPDTEAYCLQHALGSHTLITPVEILQLEKATAPRLATRAQDTILQILLAMPGFDLGSYEHKDHASLCPALRPGQLHLDVEGNVEHYMLKTIHQAEASYEGNKRCMANWLHQLDLDSTEAEKELGKYYVIPWVGDQLTCSRLRSNCNIRCDDFNPFERRDWLSPQIGFFHLMFAFEHSLHGQYYSTRNSLGLAYAFDVMDRRGLQSPSTQGTFHHTFGEAFDHTFEARIRDLWCVVGKVKSLSELRKYSPEELCSLATTIHKKYASTCALVELDALPAGSSAALPPQDPLFRQSVMFNRDALDYRMLRDAITCGDVQTMEDLLPRLALRFLGGSNKNYAIEVCELLQCLHKEWTPDYKQGFHATTVSPY